MAGKRGPQSQAKRVAANSAKKRDAAVIEQQQVHFLDDEDEQPKKRLQQAGESEEEEAQETAEEKRLRLAKEYLQNMQAHMEVEVEDEGARRGVTGDSDDEGAGRDKLGERLKRDTAEASGRVQRRLAAGLQVPDLSGQGEVAWSCKRGHRLAATAVALSDDERHAYTVSKDGIILMWDLASMRKKRLYRPGESTKANQQARASQAGGNTNEGGGADWVRQKARSTSQLALHAVAVSFDGTFLAVGGGDKKVHVFDGQTGEFIQSFPGHRDAVTCLAFREGSHQLFSGSLDRTVKLWSLDDRAYMDTLFGHQAEVLALDVLRAERVVSSGGDRACRVWKIPEESQLLYRYGGGPGSSAAIDTCRYITGVEWLSGSSDGSLQLWTQLKKKPVSVVRHAHGPHALSSGFGAKVSAGAIGPPSQPPQQQQQQQGLLHEGRQGQQGAFSVPVVDIEGTGVSALSRTTESIPDVTGWVQSVAVCRGSDLVASGAGDGVVRLWGVEPSKQGGAGSLRFLGGLPARGFVNGLAVAKSGKFLVAAVGQEPRLGRWARDGAARNGLLLHRLDGSQ